MSNTFPTGWTKTIADLVGELPDRVPAQQEWEWARAYERSELRKWARFPVDGDLYELTDDVPVKYLTHWLAPFTDGGSGVLRSGTRVRVSVMKGDPEPVGVYADAIERDQIERELVPESVRADPKYNGFSLSITTAELNRLYRHVPAHVA